jgi:HAMP domain-containing protein
VDAGSVVQQERLIRRTDRHNTQIRQIIYFRTFDMRLNIKTVIVLGISALMMAPALIAGTIYTNAVHQRAESVNMSRLKTVGQMASNQLGRRMHQLWRDVEGLSRALDLEDTTEIRRLLSFMSHIDPRFTWIGVANVEGNVLAASHGLLEGQSVAERPWFRRGLNAPTAVDVHDAKLLEKLLPARPEPRRFVDFSAPLKDSMGRVIGVVGAHFDWDWVESNLAGLHTPGVDMLLVARDQRVLFGPDGLRNTTLSVGSAIAAGQAVSIPFTEHWPDGKDYFTVTLPIQFEDMPSFGWSLIVRADTESALAPTKALIRSFWTMLGAGFLVALGLLYLFAIWLSSPLIRIVNTAEQLADGKADQPPYEETRYAEAARLSAALVRLQALAMTPHRSASTKKPDDDDGSVSHVRLVK